MKLKRNTRKTKYGSGENETGPGECASYAISIRGLLRGLQERQKGRKIKKRNEREERERK